MWKYLLILTTILTACSCGCAPKSAKFEGPLVDKKWMSSERNKGAGYDDKFVVFFRDKEIGQIIRVTTTPNVYYNTAIGQNIAFTLDENELRWYDNGDQEECEKIMDRKTIKPAREYLKNK